MKHGEKIDEILAFWFDGDPEARRRRWWQKSSEVDASCRSRFAEVLQAAKAGELDAWLQTPRGRQAFVILCDQLARNMHRDTAGMYEADALAQRATLAALEAGDDRQMDDAERQFLYMPLMHSEALEHQERCVELFRELAKGGVIDSVKWAVQHRDIVARFGRFPHRNAILGRQSSAEELAFLEQPGSSF
ncbi:MAG: DUF924 domain-containing protein [Myxococcales bacterium]|nr:DUF924 domain-containing protein [Myxococcales bacterium]